MQTSGAARREDAKLRPRHCERSEAIHSFFAPRGGLLRFARNDVERARCDYQRLKLLISETLPSRYVNSTETDLVCGASFK